jgi:predicted nucleotidyltransferase
MANDLTPIKQELDTLTKVIAETVPVEAIYLFGSYAYGTPRQDSDLDLYVVLKDDYPSREGDAYCAIQMAIRKNKARKRPMDILVDTKSRFLYHADSISLIEKTVAQEGIRIYG